MQPGDLVKVKFAQEEENGVIIKKWGTGLFYVLVDGELHRSHDSMMEKIVTELPQDEAQ